MAPFNMKSYNLGFISDEPDIIEDVVSDNNELAWRNTVYEELMSFNPDVLKSLYLLAFSTYEGFDSLF